MFSIYNDMAGVYIVSYCIIRCTFTDSLCNKKSNNYLCNWLTLKNDPGRMYLPV